jgi:cytochrome c oxidase subunit 1
MYPERLATAAAFGVILGFIITFVPQFLLGNAGMPRRYHTYPPYYQPMHVISTVGSWMIGGASLLVITYLLWAVKWGRRVGPNPWGVLGLEWTISSPPPKHNFEVTPVVTHGPYDYWKVPKEEYAGDSAPGAV